MCGVTVFSETAPSFSDSDSGNSRSLFLLMYSQTNKRDTVHKQSSWETFVVVYIKKNQINSTREDDRPFIVLTPI
jgi:hypothetical protein